MYKIQENIKRKVYLFAGAATGLTHGGTFPESITSLLRRFLISYDYIYFK